MKLLTRYMLQQLLFTIIVIAVVLTFIVWLGQSLRFVDIIANRGVSIILFLEMVFYLLPNLVVIVLPVSILIGILFIYNKLTTDHELHVMQASGVSFWQLARPSLILAFFCTIILYSFTLYLLPLSFRKFRDIETTLNKDVAADLLQPGQFNTYGKFTVYTREKDKDGRFLGILLYDGRSPEKVMTYIAKEGVLLNQADSTQIVMLNGNRQETDLKTGKPTILYFDQYTVETRDKMANSERFFKPYERFITDLLNPSDAHLSEKARLQFNLAAHQRILSPLFALAYTSLALCAMLLGEYRRQTRWKRVMVACGAAIVIQVVTLILMNLIKYSFIAIPSAYAVILGVILVTCASLKLKDAMPYEQQRGDKK